jgi:hypothetical protein
MKRITQPRVRRTALARGVAAVGGAFMVRRRSAPDLLATNGTVQIRYTRPLTGASLQDPDGLRIANFALQSPPIT